MPTKLAKDRECIVNKFYITGNYRLQGGNLQAHWYEAPMTASGGHRDIRPYEKSAHLLVCSPAIKAFFINEKYLMVSYRGNGPSYSSLTCCKG